MANYFLIFCRKAYECNNRVLPKFTKEELDSAEVSTNGFIGTKISNGVPIDYFLHKLLNTNGN